jgi:hypothetical protein
METIPYRNTKLEIKTIPKDTLLFRMVQNPTDDLRGMSIGDGKRCLTPNYNVFFYPNPFAGPFAFEKYPEYKNMTMYIYKLKNDVKVLWLLNPSKYSRRDKNRKRIFIKSCQTVKKGCLPRTGSAFDPCLSDTMIKKYPDVVGIMSIAWEDNYYINNKLRKTQKLKKYFKNANDSRGRPGIPELILHPLKQRPQKDLITVDSDPLEQNYEKIGKYPQNDSALRQFMDKHAEYNPNSYFFTYR